MIALLRLFVRERWVIIMIDPEKALQPEPTAVVNLQSQRAGTSTYRLFFLPSNILFSPFQDSS